MEHYALISHQQNNIKKIFNECVKYYTMIQSTIPKLPLAIQFPHTPIKTKREIPPLIISNAELTIDFYHTVS